MDVSNLTKDHLAELLRDAEHEHGKYEQELGTRDENWPEWYASYMLERLRSESTQ